MRSEASSQRRARPRSGRSVGPAIRRNRARIADKLALSVQEFATERLPMSPAILRAMVLTFVGVAGLGCGKEEHTKGQAQASAKAVIRPSASIAALLTPGTQGSASLASKELEEPSEHLVSSSRSRHVAPKFGKHRLVLDDLVDVAPAGPSAATPIGVVLVTRDGRTQLARLSNGVASGPSPARTPITPLEASSADFVALERGPATSGGFAYFVHGGHLVRRQLGNGEIENLAEDARSYTRVAVPDLPLDKAPAIAAYVARHPTEKDTLIAKLWVEGQGTVPLTPDGSAGNSVALARAGGGYLAISLESRTGMSPLHARRISFSSGKVKLSSDLVPWVAGTAQPLSEIHAVGDPWSVWALLAMERDATRFGLARIDLGLEPRMGATVHWREYPNGVEPAVVASGYLCDRPVVLYARPANAEPHATQELQLASIGPDGLGPATIVASSRAFADASFASLDGGALVVYVADRRTWARRLRCLL